MCLPSTVPQCLSLSESLHILSHKGACCRIYGLLLLNIECQVIFIPSCISSTDRMINEYWIWKDVDGESLGVIWCTISPFTSKEWGNHWIPGWKDGIRAKIWNQDLQNTRHMTLTRSETTCYVSLIMLLGFLFVFCIMSLIPSNHAHVSVAFVVNVCVNRYWRRGSSDLLKRNYCSRIPTIPCIYTPGRTFVERYVETFAHIVWPQINFDISYFNIRRITYSLCMISNIC